MPPVIAGALAVGAFASANAGTIAAVGAVAGTALSTVAALRQGQVGGQTSILNSKLRGQELQAQAVQVSRQAQLIDREAQSFDYAAIEARGAAAFEAARHGEQARAFKAKQRVDVAGSGLEATGSPLFVMAETARQLELDELTIKHAGEVQARGAEDEARLSRYQAGLMREQAAELRRGIPITLDIGRYQARASRQAGSLGATRSILGGAVNMARIYDRRPGGQP